MAKIPWDVPRLSLLFAGGLCHVAIQDWRDPRLALHLGEATLVRKVVMPPPPFVLFLLEITKGH